MDKFLVVILLALAGCAQTKLGTGELHSSAEEDRRRNLLVGKWRGTSQTVAVGTYHWLIERRKDGTCTLWSKLGNGKVNVEEGNWGVSAHIYFRTSKRFFHEKAWVPIPSTATADAAAAIEHLDPERFSIRYLEGGESLTMKRASDDEILQ